MKTRRSHYLPRTRKGLVAVTAFLVLFAFTQPPLVFRLANRIEPWVAGVPFMYAYLFVLYVALIGVLLWAALPGGDRPSGQSPRRERKGD